MLPFLQRSRQVIWLQALGTALLASCERRFTDPVLDIRAQLPERIEQTDLRRR
jgi:hypothetical protein